MFNKIRERLSLVDKRILAGAVILFLLSGSISVIKLSQRLSTKRVAYKPKAETGEINPNCKIVAEVIADEITPSIVPSVAPTLAITPTIFGTPTPPVLKCNNLQMLGAVNNTINLGQSVTLTASFDRYAILRSGMVGKVGERVIQAERNTWQSLAKANNSLSYVFKPEEEGIYVFEINVYESEDCRYLCSSGSILYRNKTLQANCDREPAPEDWEQLGSCPSENCVVWLTVKPSPLTPTSGLCGQTGSYCQAIPYSCNTGEKDLGSQNCPAGFHCCEP